MKMPGRCTGHKNCSPRICLRKHEQGLPLLEEEWGRRSCLGDTGLPSRPPPPPVPQPGRGEAFNPLPLALARASPRYLPALKFYDYRVASHRERQ